MYTAISKFVGRVNRSRFLAMMSRAACSMTSSIVSVPGIPRTFTVSRGRCLVVPLHSKEKLNKPSSFAEEDMVGVAKSQADAGHARTPKSTRPDKSSGSLTTENGRSTKICSHRPNWGTLSVAELSGIQSRWGTVDSLPEYRVQRG